jgi:hypothetical protein
MSNREIRTRTPVLRQITIIRLAAAAATFKNSLQTRQNARAQIE